MEVKYRITPKGSLTLDITDNLNQMIEEQSQEVAAMLEIASNRIRNKDDNFTTAFYIANALTILGVFDLCPKES